MAWCQDSASVSWQFSHLWHSPGQVWPRGIPAVTDMLHYGYYLMPGPNVRGGVPALLCSRDQSELLYLRDKAAPKHPALFFSFIFFSAYFFCSFSRFSNENAATHRWTSGWKCRQGDKSIVVWGSIQSKNSGAHKPHCADKDRNHRPIAISFLLTLIFRYGTNLFFFSLVLSWCLYLRGKKWMTSILKAHCLQVTDLA